MAFAVFTLLLFGLLACAYVKVKNDRALDIAESNLDDDLDPELVEAAMSSEKQNWDAAQ